MDRPKRPSYQGQQPQTGNPRYQGGGNRYKGGPRPPGGNLPYDVYQSAARRLNRFTSFQLFYFSIIAGALFTAGSLLAVLLTSEIVNPANQVLLSALGLTIGMLLVILTNTILFSEGNIYVPYNFDQQTIARSCLRLFHFWLITWIGNFIGAFIFSYFVYLSQEYSPALHQTFGLIMSNKLAYSNGLMRGTGELIISGMLANWLIVIGTFYAIASRNLINQFIILFLLFVLIIAANFQYFPANLGYFLLGAFTGNTRGLADAIFLNLIPVSLGNILGGSLLACGTLLLLSRKRSDRSTS